MSGGEWYNSDVGRRRRPKKSNVGLGRQQARLATIFSWSLLSKPINASIHYPVASTARLATSIVESRSTGNWRTCSGNLHPSVIEEASFRSSEMNWIKTKRSFLLNDVRSNAPMGPAIGFSSSTRAAVRLSAEEASSCRRIVLNVEFHTTVLMSPGNERNDDISCLIHEAVLTSSCMRRRCREWDDGTTRKAGVRENSGFLSGLRGNFASLYLCQKTSI